MIAVVLIIANCVTRMQLYTKNCIQIIIWQFCLPQWRRGIHCTELISHWRETSPPSLCTSQWSLTLFDDPPHRFSPGRTGTPSCTMASWHTEGRSSPTWWCASTLWSSLSVVTVSFSLAGCVHTTVAESDSFESLTLWSDILLNVFLAIAVDNLAGGGAKKNVE